MTGREKLAAAMSESGTASVPLVVCYSEIFMRDHWERVTREPWWMMYSPDVEAGIRAQRDLLAVTGEDRARVWMSPPRTDRERCRIEGIDAYRARRVDAVTGESQELLRPPPGGFVDANHLKMSGDRRPSSREEIDATWPLPPEETQETLSADGRLDRPRRVAEEFGVEKMLWTQLPSPWDPLPFAWGFEGLMMACAETPELVEYACRRIVACNRRRVATWKAAGVGLVWIEDCGSDQVSPGMYERMVLPAMQELTADLRRAGVLSIDYYTGDPNDRLELLLQTGADALALEESRKGFTIDMATVARQVDGRMALVGNLDAAEVLEKGPTNAIHAEVERQVEAGRRNGGRFIMGVGSPVTPGTPLTHVRALREALDEIAP